MRCLFKFRKDHIEALHQADFLGFKLLQLVCERSLGICNLALHAKVILCWSLTRLQCGVDGVGCGKAIWPLSTSIIVRTYKIQICQLESKYNVRKIAKSATDSNYIDLEALFASLLGI